MRRVTITQPFTDGLVTDVPAHQLGPRMASEAENVMLIDGVATRRLGHLKSERFGFSEDTASPILGVKVASFALADRANVCMVVTVDGGYAKFGTGSGSEFRFLGSTTSSTNLIDYDVLPRCVYNDEVILCDQSGERGIRRYAGAGHSDAFEYEFRQFSATNKPTIAMNTTAGSREFDYALPGTNDGNIVALATLTASQPGWYVKWNTVPSPAFSSKIANVYSTSKGTLLSAVSSGMWATTTATVHETGVAYPAVSIYSAGAVTIATSPPVVTGIGTEWQDGGWGKVDVDANDNLDHEQAAILYSFGGVSYHRVIGAPTSNTSIPTISIPVAVTTPSQYHITRGLPFKDACVHRGSLCGAGVKQYPNRVYIAPPGWDMESPPGSVPPLRMEAASFQNADPNYFLLDFIDVPSTVDTDPVVAILPSTGPLLVVKEDSLYGIYGDWPSFTQSLIAEDVGCLDRRSAISTEYGQFWAGPDGIYRYTPQTGPVDITAGRINKEWRQLAARKNNTGWTCVMAVSNGKLVVACGDGAWKKSLVYSLDSGVWDGYQTFPQPIAMEPSGVPATLGSNQSSTTADSLVVAAKHDILNTSASKCLREYGPMMAGIPGTCAIDHGSTKPPTMTATTSTGLARNEGIDGLSRMVDVSMSGVCRGFDPSGARESESTYTTLKATAVISGGIDDSSWTAAASTGIGEDADGGATRRVRTRVGVNGRLHSITVTAESASDADDNAVGVVANAGVVGYVSRVHQLTATFRDSRGRA